MKKRLFASAIVLGAFIVTPKFISGQVEPTLNGFVSSLDNNPAYAAKIKSANYGWFSSDAVVEVTLDLASMMQSAEGEIPEFDTSLVFDIDFSASHGLITTENGLGLNLIDWTASYQGEAQKEHIQWDDTTPLYAIHGQTNLIGSGTFSDVAPAFTAKQNASGLSIDFAGHQGSGSYDSKGYQYQGGATKLAIENEEITLNFADLSMAINADGSFVDAFAGKLFDSYATVTLKKIDFQAKQFEQTFSMVDTVFATDAKLKGEGELMDAVVDYKVGKIETSDFVSTDLVFSAAVNNISVELMEGYQALSQEIVGMQPDEVQTKMLEFVQTHLLNALTPQPEFNITDFSGTIPQGNFALKADSKIVGVDTMPANLMDPGFWLTHMVANAELNADKAVIEMLAAQQLTTQLMANPDVANMSEEEIAQIIAQQTPMMLDNLSQQGLLIQTEDGYRTKFVLVDSQAKINETPIPLPGV